MKYLATTRVEVPVYRERAVFRSRPVQVLAYKRLVIEVDIQALFRDDPVGLEKYQERRLGIERRLDKVIKRKQR
jgi:hypothetical protein